MSDDDTTTQILLTVQNIVSGLKSELQQVKSAQLKPEDVRKLVEAHTAPHAEELRQIQSSVTALKVKSQQRLTMDDDLINELQRRIEQTLNVSVPDEVRSLDEIKHAVEETADESAPPLDRQPSFDNSQLVARVANPEPVQVDPPKVKKTRQDLFPETPLKERRLRTPVVSTAIPIVKTPAIQKETRFTAAQRERSKVYEEKRAARRTRLEQQAPEMLAAAEEQQRELLEQAELNDAIFALQNLQDNPPKTKNPVLLSDYKVEVAQAELDLAMIKCKKLRHHEQERILFPLRKRLEAATIHANCCHT